MTTRLSITCALASLTVSLAPAANAYGTAMDAVTPDALTPAVLTTSAQTGVEGACAVNITAVLAAALGLTAQSEPAAPAVQQACLSQ